MAQLPGQENRRAARASAGHQHPETVAKALFAVEAIVVEHRQIFQPGPCQPLVLVLRLAVRVGQRLILLAHQGQVVDGVEDEGGLKIRLGSGWSCSRLGAAEYRSADGA
ncbi:MAG: hypothetical protein LH632_06420 [Rhodoferax sp.]|nr:hypothetical protein [Rhodoferax sp.]